MLGLEHAPHRTAIYRTRKKLTEECMEELNNKILERIENARRLTPDAKFYVSQAESLPLPDASVDLVFSTTSFHHWRDQEQGLREIKRVLQVGGLLFLADIWPPFGLSKLIRHFQTNNPNALRETFSRAGFHVQNQRKWWMLWLVVTVGERC